MKNKSKFKKKANPNQKGNSKRMGNKDKGNCFHYKKPRHWKRNRKQYLDELKAKKKGKGKCDLLVLETCLVESDISTWVIDSGATNHVCFSLQSFTGVGYSKMASTRWSWAMAGGFQ